VHKFLFVFILGLLVPAHVFGHGAGKKQEIYSITQIHELCPFLTNLPKGAVVVFDVDFVIIAPADDIGLPGSKEIRKAIFREYSKEHGKQQAEDLFVLFNKLVKRPLVEARIRPIIQDLMRETFIRLPFLRLVQNQWELF
jgi:tetrahydromethanopterin S-methyltransferase subunit A